eukprot:m.89007 g.89007  ORF g.89007 m.89007 type:complete len:258 (+) comp13639_c1_seq3:2976-3749(+)
MAGNQGLPDLLRAIYLEGVAMLGATNKTEAKERFFTLCQTAIVDAELFIQETSMRTQQYQLGKEQVEDASARARSLQDRIKLVERQLERQKIRSDTLQTQLDEVQRARIATATRLAATRELARPDMLAAGGSGDATAQLIDVQRKLRSAVGECDSLREANKTLTKENEKLQQRVSSLERESMRAGEQARQDREGRGETVERLRARVKELEDQLRGACEVQVRQQQRARLEREQKMWQRLERQVAEARATARPLPAPL